MGSIRRIYDCMAWYPWLSSISRDIMTGNIKERLPMQKPKDRPLSILLNGPSLNDSLKYLEREKTDVCMVNYAITKELYVQMKPEYVCLADPNFFIMNRKRYYDFYKRIDEINPEQIIFYPSYAKPESIKKGRKQFKRVYRPEVPFDPDKYSIKLLEKNLMAPSFINVGIMALYVGIQLGYKNIFLYGADLSYIKSYSINNQLKVEIEDSHFYGNRKLILPNNMNVELQNIQRTFSQFYIMEKYAKAEHVKIINMSDESMLDCFERYKHE